MSIVVLFGIRGLSFNENWLKILRLRLINIFFMKLFKTTDINIMEMCQQSFSFRLPSDILPKRFDKFVGSINREKWSN